MASGSDKSGDNLYATIKALFPSLACTKKSLEQPNREFALEFYQLFLNEYFEGMSYLKKQEFHLLSSEHLAKLNTDHSHEMIVYWSMKVWFRSLNMKFIAEDLYSPSRDRTKKFLQICTHFLRFFQEILYKKLNFNEIFQMLNTKKELADKSNEIASRLDETRAEVARETEQVAMLEEIEDIKMKKYEKFQLEAQHRREKLQKEKSKLGTLKTKLLSEQLKSEKYKSASAKLRETIVDEDEIEALEEIIALLKEKFEQLGQQFEEKSKKIIELNGVAEHLKVCLEELEKLKFPEDDSYIEENEKILAYLQNDGAKMGKLLGEKNNKYKQLKNELRAVIESANVVKNQEERVQKGFREKMDVLNSTYKANVKASEEYLEKFHRIKQEFHEDLMEISRKYQKLKNLIDLKNETTLENKKKFIQALSKIMKDDLEE